MYLIFLLQYRVDWGFFDRRSTVTGVRNKLAQLGYHGFVKVPRKLGMGNWEWGIGNGELGMGNWTEFILSEVEGFRINFAFARLASAVI